MKYLQVDHQKRRSDVNNLFILHLSLLLQIGFICCKFSLPPLVFKEVMKVFFFFL